MAGRQEGTHKFGRRDSEGRWPNCAAPRTRRQGETKAEKKLSQRLAAYDRLLKGKPKTACHRPGSLNRKKG